MAPVATVEAGVRRTTYIPESETRGISVLADDATHARGMSTSYSHSESFPAPRD